jgi:hypothetical protein
MAKPDRKPPKKSTRSLRGKGPTPKAEDRPTIRNISQKRIQRESALRENELILSAALKVIRNLPKGATFAAMNVSM